jgi:hypothetical protein
MKSDTNIVKLFGIFGAILVFMAMFMNVITLDFHIGLTDEMLAELGEDDFDVHLKYGVTMWELRTMAENFTNALSGEEFDDEGEDEISDDITNEILEYANDNDLNWVRDMIGAYGFSISDDTVSDLTAFVKYSFTAWILFLVLPWVMFAAAIVMAVGTITSKKAVKIVSTVIMTVGFVSLFLPAGEFLRIIGVGPVIMLCGIGCSIISTVGSFVSPGVIYVEE